MIAAEPAQWKLIGTNGTRGPAAWLISLAIAGLSGARLDLVAAMYLLAVCVLVPAGLSLQSVRRARSGAWGYRVARPLMFPAALLTAAAFMMPKGAAAAALASGWLIHCALLALGAMQTLPVRHERSPESLAIAAALLFLPIGAFWALLSRAGGWSMGFQEPIVLLTGVHFHYTGFAASILTAMAGATIDRAQPMRRPWYVVALFAQLASTPMIAAGFVVSPMLQVSAILLLTISISAVSILLLLSLRIVHSAVSSMLLSASACSALLGMLLAVVYGIGEYVGKEWISIDQMAVTHGLINGFGYVLCGLLGWRWLQPLPSRGHLLAQSEEVTS